MATVLVRIWRDLNNEWIFTWARASGRRCLARYCSHLDGEFVGAKIVCMKKITLSADERLIEAARAVARAGKTTLNQMFREWLAGVAGRKERAVTAAAVMKRLAYVESGGGFSREAMNER